MYIPKANEEKRISVMHQMITAHPLAVLVTLNSSGLIASHIPMTVEARGEYGVLKGHIARANNQWRALVSSVEALAVFSGPAHYISASWYPGTKEHGREVPTWNYVVVHAYGTLKIIEDSQWLRAHLESLSDKQEAHLETPWKVRDAPEEFIASLSNSIVGLELAIRSLEGKWKVSQNRTESDKRGVIDGLSKLNTAASISMKTLVEGK